jgi:hypothetical protein
MTLTVRVTTRLTDWRLRRALQRSGLPDLPEVRKFMRMSYWNGFTFGSLQSRMPAARAEALIAVARHACTKGDHDDG